MGLFGGGSKSASYSTTKVEAGNDKQVGAQDQGIAFGSAGRDTRGNTGASDNGVSFGASSRENLTAKDDAVILGRSSKLNALDANAKQLGTHAKYYESGSMVMGNNSTFTSYSSFDDNELKVFQSFAAAAGDMVNKAQAAAQSATEKSMGFVKDAVDLIGAQNSVSTLDKYKPILYTAGILTGLYIIFKGGK